MGHFSIGYFFPETFGSLFWPKTFGFGQPPLLFYQKVQNCWGTKKNEEENNEESEFLRFLRNFFGYFDLFFYILFDFQGSFWCFEFFFFNFGFFLDLLDFFDRPSQHNNISFFCPKGKKKPQPKAEALRTS